MKHPRREKEKTHRQNFLTDILFCPKKENIVNKRFISYVTLFAFSLASIPGKADVSEDITYNQVMAESQNTNSPLVTDTVDGDATEDYDYYEPEGSDVNKSDNKSKNAAKRQMWINIGLAVAAVVVAVTALCIVSNNNGHDYHKN